MRVFIDVDLHQAIADFATRQPAPTYTFKSQDTIDFQIYFVQAGVVQDYGSGFALKFGMIKTGDATNTILAYQTACTYLTDSDGQVYYQMQVVMNTSQMATAIGTSASIGCTIELRYQDSLNEIIHTLNLSAIVYATILTETGVTPPNVSTGYPDASTIELLVHKNAPSGYAGLDSSSHLNGAVIPVDGQTVALNGSGQVSSAAILAYTAANFTTPASGSTVSVTFGSTAKLKAGSYVRIPIAGYYIVQSVTNPTTAVLTNNGDPFNALAGVTITSGAVVLPAQAAAGGGGTPGQSAYTTLTAGFTVPAAGATVSLTVVSTAWMPGNGYALFIGGAGYYLVNSITDSTHVVVTNSGSAANQPPGTTVNTGATVTGAGPQGAPGAAGASLSAYTATTAAFTMPSVGAPVTIIVGNTGWVSQNQIIFVAGAGYFQVGTVANATTLSCNNLNYPGNATAGAVISSGANVTPAGLQGPQGAGGPGLNAFTTLSASYTQPAPSAMVTVAVGTTAWMAASQGIYIQGGGYYTISSISDLTHVVIINLGGSANAAQGSTITGGGTPSPTVAPAGIPGTTGINAYTTTTANFTTPAAGSSTTISVGVTSWASFGQNIFIAGAGYYQIASILSVTQLSVTNLGANYGNTSGGTTVNSGASVSPAGVIGPAGPPGSQGAAGRDGAYATIYTGSSIQGTGGVASPATLVGDVAQGTGAYKIYQRDSSGNSKWDVALLSATDAISTPGTGEVSHIQSLANGILAIKKLKAGTGVTLTDQGGTTGDILIAAAGGGGGVFDPRGGYYAYQDFETNGPTTNFPYWSGQATVGTGSGIKWANANILSDSTHKAIGVLELQTGNVTGNSGCFFCYGGTGINSTNGGIMLGPGTMDLASRMAIETSLPATGTGYLCRFGFQISNTVTPPITPVNSVFLEYSPDNNSGNLRLGYNTASGAITYVNTSQALTADTFAWWEIKIDTSGNITAYFNGASIATAGPVAGLLWTQLAPYWYNFRNSGTAIIYVAIDTLFASMPYTR